MSCSHCNAPVELTAGGMSPGLPKYWVGTRRRIDDDTSVPEHVHRVYCSAQCSLDDHEERRV